VLAQTVSDVVRFLANRRRHKQRPVCRCQSPPAPPFWEPSHQEKDIINEKAEEKKANLFQEVSSR